ncbi:hypothetical protein CFP56_035725 [Quercus suber]|uniref:Uncharacterized protein n=1 Tax=Quercus suber TaxID=58331 RepID=A0AAW0J9I8_QUESU
MASAGIWFLVFGLFLIFVCCCCFFRKGGHGGYSQVVYFIAVILIILFTFVAITGNTILFLVKANFQSNMQDMTEYTSNQVKSTTKTL